MKQVGHEREAVASRGRVRGGGGRERGGVSYRTKASVVVVDAPTSSPARDWYSARDSLYSLWSSRCSCSQSEADVFSPCGEMRE